MFVTKNEVIAAIAGAFYDAEKSPAQRKIKTWAVQDGIDIDNRIAFAEWLISLSLKFNGTNNQKTSTSHIIETFIIPKEIPRDIFKMSPKDWCAWARIVNWPCEDCYHPPELVKEFITGINRRTGEPIPNPVIHFESWDDLGGEFDPRFMSVRGIVQTFRRWLLRSSK
jgi:hypothetical protein